MRKSKDIYSSKSSEETKKIAEKIIKKIAKKQKPREGAIVVALTGELGAGKTNFAQGVGEYLGINKTITSPTFVIMKRYSISGENMQARRTTDFLDFYHLDCYRVYSPEELLDLGWKDIIADSKNIILLEWAERVKSILPNTTAWVTIDSKGENQRSITVEA